MEARMVEPGAGTLFVVSTPIGNMGDFSFRAVEILREVSVILAEDTRHTKHLLAHYQIETPMQSYHEHTEARSTPRIVRRLLAGENVALVSDAGTPLLSDPGERLVSAAIEAGVPVSPVPGASAALAALVVAGVAVSPFTFYGFPPRKGRARSNLFSELASLRHSAIMYEAANRPGVTLADLAERCGGERVCVVARELTKKFEEVRRGTLTELTEYYASREARGEIVLVLAGAPDLEVDENELRQVARALRIGGLSKKEIVGVLVRDHKCSRNLAYRLAEES